MPADDVAGRSPGSGPLLVAVELPVAPPVLRGVAVPLRQRRAPAIALLVLGAALILGPIVGGLFAKVASANQMIDEFAPHLEPDALARYDSDLALLRRGAASVDEAVAQQRVPPGRFPGIDEYRAGSAAIDQHATGLLDRIESAEPDYREVSDIGGFDRVPFLLVLGGLASVYGACVLLGGSRSRARGAAAVVVLASAALVGYPLLGDLPSGTRAGERMLDALQPVMTPEQVVQLQLDFVVLVQAVGELDTGFREVPVTGAVATDLAAFVQGWPDVSSDLATLVGTVNDNIDNYRDLDDLDRITSGIGVSGLTALPWALVGFGLLAAGCSIAAVPRRQKETP